MTWRRLLLSYYSSLEETEGIKGQFMFRQAVPSMNQLKQSWHQTYTRRFSSKNGRHWISREPQSKQWCSWFYNYVGQLCDTFCMVLYRHGVEISSLGLTEVFTFVFDVAFTSLLLCLSVNLHDYFHAAYVPILCVLVPACVHPCTSVYLGLSPSGVNDIFLSACGFLKSLQPSCDPLPLVASEPGLHSLLESLWCSLAPSNGKREDVQKCLFHPIPNLVT